MRKYSMHLAASCLSLVSIPANAQSASSSGFALKVNQTVTAPAVANATVTVGPLAATSGSAGADYNVSNQVLSLDQTAALTSGVAGTSERLQTGVLSSSSTGTATGASATATANNVSVGIGPTTDAFIATLFGLGATTIQSQSTASSLGGLSASGSTTIAGLTLTGSAFNGLTFDASAFINPMKNTVLFTGGGLSIVLNEQTPFGDGITSSGITTNAIDVAFNNFAVGTGFKSGNIILGQTQAAVTAMPGAVPEPSTWAMMLVGFGAIGFSMRRRPNKATPQLA